MYTEHNIRVASDSVTPWATTDTGWAEPTAYIVGIRFRLEWEFWYEPKSVVWGLRKGSTGAGPETDFRSVTCPHLGYT